jgi:putative membrane protein
MMAALLIAWIANSLAILAVSYLFAGVEVASPTDAFIAGGVLSIINALVKPILVLLTLPLTLLTLGLFYFVINAFCLALTAWLLPGFMLSGVFTTIVAALLVSLISMIVTRVLRRTGQ